MTFEEAKKKLLALDTEGEGCTLDFQQSYTAEGVKWTAIYAHVGAACVSGSTYAEALALMDAKLNGDPTTEAPDGITE